MSITRTFLVEVNTAVRIRDWAAESSSIGVWARTLDADMHVVTGVTQNDTTLTETTSTGGLATATRWYYNPSARKLWVRTADASNPSTCTNAMVVGVLEALMKGGDAGGGLVLTRGIVSCADVFWDNRVIALPSVSQQITPDELGAGSVATFGEIVVNNGDGRYDRLVGERIFAGQTVTVLRSCVGLRTSEVTYDAMSTWLKAVQEQPSVAPLRATVQLVSLGRRLDRPIQTCVYSTAEFANLDPNVTGFNRPKAWGKVIQAEALRVGTCTWEVAGHALTALDSASVKTATGTSVTVLSTILASGQFTAATSHADTEQRLYVDVTGVDVHTPGNLIVSVGKDFGLSTSSEMDGTALSLLDTNRGVSVGFQVRTGSVADALNIVARSAFVDWYVDRKNLLGGRVRARDAGNKIDNGTFETGTAGWQGRKGATIAQTTAVRFRGAASLQVTKACEAANAAAEAVAGGAVLVTGRTYTVTLMAALTCAQASTAFRVGIGDGGGTCGGSNYYLADGVALSTAEWTRVTHEIRGMVRDAIFWSRTSTDIVMSSTLVTFGGAGGEVVVRPQDGGVESVRCAIDDVEIVETVLLDDTNSEWESARTAGPVAYRVRAGYAFDGRLASRRFAQRSDGIVQRLFRTAESRQIDGHLVCTTDGETVAQAVLDYLSANRVRSNGTLLSPEDVAAVNIMAVADMNTSRRPTLPGMGRLYRVTGYTESHDEASVPRLRVTAEAQTDPIFNLDAVSIT